MSTRTRPMGLDGYSLEADQLADERTKAKVEVVLVDILARVGKSTSDALEVLYEARAEAYPDVPRVSPQRIRTCIAALNRRGLVVADPEPGVSARGNRATQWRLPERKAA